MFTVEADHVLGKPISAIEKGASVAKLVRRHSDMVLTTGANPVRRILQWKTDVRSVTRRNQFLTKEASVSIARTDRPRSSGK